MEKQHPITALLAYLGSERRGGFDPEGDGYDYAAAKAAGLIPGYDGHWPSRHPRTGQLLKGRRHPTWPLTEQGEIDAGHEIYKGIGGYYFSRPKKRSGMLPGY